MAAIDRSGYGSGSGDVDVDGDGDGDGHGYGSGCGYGSGDIQNSIAYWAALTDVPEAHEARRKGAVIALWKSTGEGKPANGGSLAKPVAVGDVHEGKGPLRLCTDGTLHATFDMGKWKGDRWWVVAMYGEIAVQSDKIGALKREILAEITQ